MTDYTNLPLGLQLDGGEIQACPHCNRIGLRQEIDGKIHFAHSHLAETDEKNNLMIRMDICPKKSKTTHPE